MTSSGRCMMVLILICSGLFIFAGPSAAVFAFAPGKEIRYNVRWQMCKAGEAVIRVLPEIGSEDVKSGGFPSGNALVQNPGTGISLFCVLNGKTCR